MWGGLCVWSVNTAQTVDAGSVPPTANRLKDLIIFVVLLETMLQHKP